MRTTIKIYHLSVQVSITAIMVTSYQVPTTFLIPSRALHPASKMASCHAFASRMLDARNTMVSLPRGYGKWSRISGLSRSLLRLDGLNGIGCDPHIFRSVPQRLSIMRDTLTTPSNPLSASSTSIVRSSLPCPIHGATDLT